MKSSRFLVLGALVLSMALLPGMAVAQGNGNGNGVNLNVNLQPALIYTVMTGLLQGGQGGSGQTGGGTGEGENGEGFMSLIVYTNGMAVLSRTGSDSGFGSGETGGTDDDNGSVQISFISQQEINQLMRSLRQGGAFRFGGLGRQDLDDTETPIAVLTIFNNPGAGQASLARTVVFTQDLQQGGRAGQLNSVLENFATGTFTGFGGFGGGSGSGSGS
jgi:hypothetical protein